MPVTRIRRARQTDCQSIWKVHSESIRKLCAQHYEPGEISAWIGFRTPDAYREAIRTQMMLVVEREGEIVGFGQLNAERGEVEAVYVAPEAAGTGVGSALLARLEEEARKRGLACLHLNSTLNAEPFYAGRGYRSLGRAKHRIRSDFALDCIRMEKPLEARPEGRPRRLP